jgi:hypothetical protein
MIGMVVTTVDIPDTLLNFIDDLVSRDKARNRREVIVAALTFYKNYEVFNWLRSRISIGGFRKAMISYNLIEQLQSKLTPEELYEMGKAMGLTLRDYMLLNYGKDSTNRENFALELAHISAMGWGEFSITDNRIRVDEPFMPKPLLQGYIESGLEIRVREVATVENVALFEIVSPTIEKRKSREIVKNGR